MRPLPIVLGLATAASVTAGVLAPAATPALIVQKLSDEIRKSLARRETRERMRQRGAEIIGDTPAEFAAFLRKDYERWAQIG